MDAISIIKSLRILDYYILGSKCNNLPEYEEALASGELKSETDAALDSNIIALQETDGVTEFTTSTFVEFCIKIVNEDNEDDENNEESADSEESEKEAIRLDLSFVTRFKVDATETEAREFFEANNWVFRQRNATISHFLGGQIIDKTAFDIGLPMN